MEGSTIFWENNHFYMVLHGLPVLYLQKNIWFWIKLRGSSDWNWIWILSFWQNRTWIGIWWLVTTWCWYALIQIKFTWVHPQLSRAAPLIPIPTWKKEHFHQPWNIGTHRNPRYLYRNCQKPVREGLNEKRRQIWDNWPKLWNPLILPKGWFHNQSYLFHPFLPLCSTKYPKYWCKVLRKYLRR